jgi:hypothetical protein
MPLVQRGHGPKEWGQSATRRAVRLGWDRHRPPRATAAGSGEEGKPGRAAEPSSMRLDATSREKLLEGLIALFYVAMALALLATLTGSPGWGFLSLLLGSLALVSRTALEAQQRQRSRPAQSPPPLPNR